MAYRDIREFIQALEKKGEVVRIEKEVDWNLEMGAITRRSHEIGAPAPWAQKIRGYPEGYTILGGQMGGSYVKGKKMPWRRLSIGMEMDPDSHHNDIVEEYIKRRKNPIKPVIVSSGPCKENIQIGKDVNLFKFPAPYIHFGDGGRYFCTWHVVVTKDPDSDWVNWGMYRAMIHTKNKMGGIFLPMQHGPGLYFQKYMPRGESMPFAIAIGTEPMTPFIGSGYVPVGVSEADVVGGMRREPIELVKCETNDLYVPAHSEIVLEGEMRPKERWDEGPFGEYTGYRASPRMARPVYRVNCITHRSNQILTMSCMGMPIDDCASMGSIQLAGEIMPIFRDNGYPVKGVYSPPEGALGALIVSTKTPYANYAHFIASQVWASAVGKFMHYIIVVDDNVDPTDMDAVFHNVVFKCHPYRGIHKHEYGPGMALDPYLDFRERQFGLGAAAVLDCTWPKDWDPEISVTLESSFRELYPKDVQEKVRKRWQEDYGYPERVYKEEV